MRNNYTGPLFVIGMPRSGTKLLRGLLNEHELISIPTNETNFLPFLHSKWNKFKNLSEYSNFQNFYNFIIQFPYFNYRARSYSNIISCRTWFDMCQNFNLGEIFEALIRHDANAPFGSKIIWGDKSPSYILHLKLLHSIYPNAKFIHIIRDVRDYCLSINKAWGKNIFRAAQRWNDDTMKCTSDSKSIPYNSYIQIRYEDLLDNTKKELANICDFLSIDFDKGMLTLSKQTENIGDAKGYLEIVSSNKEKYKSKMSISIQRKIEQIAFESLINFKYDISHETKLRRVPYVQMKLYQLFDIINLLRFRIRERGLIETLKFFLYRLNFFK